MAPLTPTRPAEAFTVVFDVEPAAAVEEPEPEEPPVPTAPPLSQFVPSKIRKSFMQREQKRKPLDKSKVNRGGKRRKKERRREERREGERSRGGRLLQRGV